MNVTELAAQSYKEYASYFDGRGNIITTIFDKEKFAELVAAHEREECANICDANGLFMTAREIRARSKA